MKKVIFLILACVMLTVCLASCGDKKNESSAPVESSIVVEESIESAPESEVISEDSDVSEEISDESDEVEINDSEVEVIDDSSVEESVVDENPADA